MAGKPIRLIAVGQLKNAHWKTAAEHYMQRLAHWRDLRCTIVKDGDPSLPVAKRNQLEGERILASVTSADCLVCLDEHGKNYTSTAFAKFLQEISENAARIPCFVIGGAFGLDACVRDAAQYTLALGPMTLPHELARVVFLEQLYRAEAIARNIPYHH